MADQPPGVFPLVFESGVIHFDEEGGLHVHLTHSSKAPHPLQTHPDGGDGFVPKKVKTAEVVGDAEDGVVHAGFLQTDDLPEGFELVVRGYKMVKLEASGDLTVVVEGVQQPPDWFSPGKVHRFDGPDGPVRLWTGSAEVPKRKPKPAPPPRTPPRPTQDQAAAGSASKGGCGLMLALVLAGGGLAAGLILGGAMLA